MPCLIVRSILGRAGWEVVEATNGAEALQMVRARDGSVDLLITDIQMPGGDGLTLARAVAAAFPAVRIILMSGYADPGEKFQFVEKPFGRTTMLAAVRRLLGQPLEA